MVSMSGAHSSFIFIGNDRAVDFVNTRIMVKGACADLLGEPGALRDWFAEAGLPIGGEIDAAGHHAALRLRGAIAGLFSAFREGEAPSRQTMNIINAHLAAHSARHCLAYDREAGYRLTEADERRSLPKALATLAYAAAMLVVETRQGALKACAADNCVLIFKDTSKGQKRRWCSMEICGNRAKAAAHYRKVSSDGARRLRETTNVEKR